MHIGIYIIKYEYLFTCGFRVQCAHTNENNSACYIFYLIYRIPAARNTHIYVCIYIDKSSARIIGIEKFETQAMFNMRD